MEDKYTRCQHDHQLTYPMCDDAQAEASHQPDKQMILEQLKLVLHPGAGAET